MMQVTKVWWDGEKLMAEPIDPASVYKEDSTCNKTLIAQGKANPRTCKKCGLGPCIADRVQPAQQEPVKYSGNGTAGFSDAKAEGFFFQIPKAQQEPVAWMTKDGEIYKHDCWPEHEARPLVVGDTSSPAQQEPYCYTYTENGEEYFAPPTAYVPDDAKPLYTSPPAQRTWVGLTANEVEEIFQKKLGYYPTIYAVEAKLKEKNQ